MSEFPQVPERGAPDEIAAIYADIRAVSGLAVTNLIWRHFAALPGALPFAWGAVRPLIGSATLDAARRQVAENIKLPGIAAPGIAAWRRAGVTEQDLERIRAMNATYIRGNLTNVLALTALRLRLEQPDRASAHLALGAPPGEPPPLLDALPRIDDLERGLAARIRALAARHTNGGGVVPSLYLALALWPGVIEALPGWLAPLYEPATLHSVRAGTCRLVEAEAGAMLPTPGRAPAAVSRMQPGLQLFTRLVIPDLVAVGLALSRVLPAAA